MKTRISAIPLIIVILFLSSCNTGQVITPTLIPAPTSTPPPTATLIPTQISTSIPVSLEYNPVPRWMILGLPGQHIEITGEIWNYWNYDLGDTYGCMEYTRKTGTSIRFEQCFAVVDSDKISFESQRDMFLGDNFETLAPNNTFGDVGQISLMGKRLVGNPTKTIEFFEIIGVEEYVLLVELYIETENTDSLQAIYESELSDIMDYVLQNMLEKSRLIPLPTSTPLSPTQEGFYTRLGEKLITESEASTLYGKTWESVGDFVDPENPMVCRDFESRNNADDLWVKFSNCILLPHPDLKFDDFAKQYEKPDNIFLESSHQYDDFILYYRFPKVHAWIMHEEYIYYVTIESRTIYGESNVEEVFTKEIDDFIYDVLMINAEK